MSNTRWMWVAMALLFALAGGVQAAGPDAAGAGWVQVGFSDAEGGGGDGAGDGDSGGDGEGEGSGEGGGAEDGNGPVEDEEELAENMCNESATERRNQCWEDCAREGMVGTYNAGICGYGSTCTCTYSASLDLIR